MKKILFNLILSTFTLLSFSQVKNENNTSGINYNNSNSGISDRISFSTETTDLTTYSPIALLFNSNSGFVHLNIKL